MGANKFQKDDRVVIDPSLPGARRYHGVVYIVEKAPTKANEVNYVLRPENGVGARVKTGEDSLLPADDEAATASTPYDEPPLLPGTVVLFRGAPHVVVAERDRRYRVFPLGGSDRSFRGVPRKELTVVPPERIEIKGE